MDVALGDVGKKIGKFREAAQAAGRDPDTIPITLVVSGDPEPSTLARYRDLGVTRATIGATRKDEDDPDSTFRFLDRYAQAAHELA